MFDGGNLLELSIWAVKWEKDMTLCYVMVSEIDLVGEIGTNLWYVRV